MFAVRGSKVILPAYSDIFHEARFCFSTLAFRRRKRRACFLVFEPPFSTSKKSFGFRLHFLYRLVGEHSVEKQKRFLVFGFDVPIGPKK